MEYPKSYQQLKYRERLFTECYLNESLIDPNLHKNTFSDKLASYVFAYNRGKDLRECISFNYKLFNPSIKSYEDVPEYINGCITTVKITNAKLYYKISRHATMIYNRCVQAINDIRLTNYDSEDKSRVLELKDAIYNTAIHSEDAKDRNENRKMALKMFGLDNVKIDTSIDVYSAGGKQILENLKKMNAGNPDAPVIPESIEDFNKDNDEDNE